MITTYEVIGRYNDVLSFGEDTLARCRRTLGPDHHHTLATAETLAFALRALGRVEQACQLLEDVLTRRRRLYGDDSLPRSSR